MSALWQEFHFLRPFWLLALVPLALLLWRLARSQRGREVLQRFCDPALLPYVTAQTPAVRQGAGLALLALGGLLTVLALAGPACQRLPQPLFREDAALVIALDLSRSMTATDLTPDRLTRARYKIRDLLATRDRGQTALVVFAGRAFEVTPLTDDVNTIVSQLEIMTPDLMPGQGADVVGALRSAGALLQQAGHRGGDSVLVTDGYPDAQRDALLTLAGAQPWRVSVLGVGSPDGAPVPTENGGFIKDAEGRIVLAKLDEAGLRQLATAGHGQYVGLRGDNADIEAINALLKQHRPGAEASAARRTDAQWADLGPWLLLPLLPLAALAFRRGTLALLLPFACALTPRPVAAIEWWFSSDQAAQRAFDREDYATAAQRFEQPAWRGAALYRKGDYAAAAENLQAPRDAESRYNHATALARLGRFKEAIAAYDAALQANPQHDDARYNKSVLEDLLREQQQEQEKEKSDSEPQQGQEQQDQQGDGDGQAKDGQQQAGGEQDGPSAGKPQDSPEQQAQKEAEQQAADQSAKSEREGRGQGNAAMDDSQRKAAAERAAQEAAAGKSEEKLSAEQWLRQVPDDPGGLWRRKFQYQYQREYGGQAGSDSAW